MEHANTEHSSSLLQSPETWVAVAFVIFAALFLRYVWPKLAHMLDGRSNKIREQLEQASRLRAEAEALLASYERERAAKEQEAKEIIAHARRDAETLRERAAADLQQALDRRSQQALEKIARAEQDATDHIRTQMIETATRAAEEIIRTQLANSKQDDPAVLRAIDAITRQVH